MAEITIRRTGELLRVLFEVLLEHPEGIRAKDAIAEVAKRVNLTPYEQGEYPSGGRRYDRIIRFATIDCVRAGWLVKRDGVWFLTERGKQAYESFSDPEKFYREARRLYNQWRSQLRDREEAEEEKTAQALLEEEEEKASSEIERYLSGMNPYDFQRLVAGLLKAMGYHVSWVAPPGKDGGVDIIAWVDPLGTRPPRVKVQVKREQSPASVHAVRAFLATLMEGEVGVFVNTGGFTRDAEQLVRSDPRHVALVDLPRLLSLWIEHYKKLDEETRSLLPLKPVYFLALNG